MMEKDDLISRKALLKDLSYCAPELWQDKDLSYCAPELWQDEEYIKAKIMKQPTIYAIPVEWLVQRMIRADDESDFEMRDCICILADEWQTEQEAIEENSNEGKIGTWEPLGHIIGYMNHPYSEYYKCSLCGHEQYTVFDLPPDTCPACRAHLTMKQEGEQ